MFLVLKLLVDDHAVVIVILQNVVCERELAAAAAVYLERRSVKIKVENNGKTASSSLFAE